MALSSPASELTLLTNPGPGWNHDVIYVSRGYWQKLFGDVIKYPMRALPACRTDLRASIFYLDFTGHKRNPNGLQPFAEEIIPGFKNVREKGLNLIDASELHHLHPPAQGTAGVVSAAAGE